jgi:hypothetical protein
MAKLLLSEFVRYTAFEDVMFEGYDDPWSRETGRWDARVQDTQAKTAQQQQQSVAQPVKDALVDFIANQLPNVRLDPNRLNLEDIVLKNGGNLATTLADPKMADFFRMLGTNVRGWLGSLKGEAQQQATALLQPFGGNISQLVKAVAPDVSAKLQQTKTNELK